MFLEGTVLVFVRRSLNFARSAELFTSLWARARKDAPPEGYE